VGAGPQTGRCPVHWRRCDILVVDVGGSHVKVLATGHRTPIKIPSGKTMTAADLVRDVRGATKAWQYEAVSVGYPGAVLHGKLVSEPTHLGSGWMGFNFSKAFGCPVRVNQRRRHAGVGQLPRRPHAVSRPGDRLGIGDDHRRRP
jgi:hypothetical protein